MLLEKISLMCLLYLHCFGELKSGDDNKLQCNSIFETCEDQPISQVSLVKSVDAKFSKCLDTRLCYNPESEVRLNELSSLLLETGGVLRLSDNSTIHMDGTESVFRINSRSFVHNAKDITISESLLRVFLMSEMTNHGEVTLKQRSQIDMFSHSELVVRKNGRISLENGAAIELSTHSLLKIYSETEQGQTVNQELIMKNSSKLRILSGSTLQLHSGKILMNEGSEWRMHDNVKVNVQGILEISKDSHLTVEGNFGIGKRHNFTKAGDQASSSLIFAKDNIDFNVNRGTSLHVLKGAHCFVRDRVDTFTRANVSLELTYNSKIGSFECFPSKDKLITVLKSLKITPHDLT